MFNSLSCPTPLVPCVGGGAWGESLVSGVAGDQSSVPCTCFSCMTLSVVSEKQLSFFRDRIAPALACSGDVGLAVVLLYLVIIMLRYISSISSF